LSAEQAARDVVVFKALANPVRLQIVSLVAGATDGQVSAGHIVRKFPLSQPTISHHLRILREAGVLTAHPTSTFVYYRFSPEVQDAVTGLIPERPAAPPPGAVKPEPTKPRKNSAGKKKTPDAKPKSSKKSKSKTKAKR
jgi:ArsR family transcriptional regulator